MIAALAIAFGAVAQAATVTWGVTGIQVTGDFETGDGTYATGYSVYLFNNAGEYSMSTMLGLITADNGWQDAMAGNLAYQVAQGEEASILKAGIQVDDGDFSGYMVILDSDITNAKNAYVTDVYTVSDNSVHKMQFGDLDGDGYLDATATGYGSGWLSVNAGAVPEPTSGLLLLLGMAGLALKRKVA